jgi:hypothetical protein
MERRGRRQGSSLPHSPATKSLRCHSAWCTMQLFMRFSCSRACMLLCVVVQEPKINSYLEFRRDVLPRVRALGYNAIQIMAVQEHAYYGACVRLRAVCLWVFGLTRHSGWGRRTGLRGSVCGGGRDRIAGDSVHCIVCGGPQAPSATTSPTSLRCAQ